MLPAAAGGKSVEKKILQDAYGVLSIELWTIDGWGGEGGEQSLKGKPGLPTLSFPHQRHLHDIHKMKKENMKETEGFSRLGTR